MTARRRAPARTQLARGMSRYLRHAERPRRQPRAAAAQAARAPRRAAAGERDRARPRPPALEHLPPAEGAARRGLRRAPARGAAVRARRRPRSSSARAYSRQEPLRWIAQTVLTRLVAATTHNAHLAVLHGRDVLYVIEERAAGRPGLVTDVGVRLPAQLTASGLAMLAALPPQQVDALFPSRRALVAPPRRRAGLAHAAARAARPRAPRRPRRGGRLRHAGVRVGRRAGARPLRAPGRGGRDHLSRTPRATRRRWPSTCAARPRSSRRRINPARTPPRPATTAPARAATPALNSASPSARVPAGDHLLLTGGVARRQLVADRLADRVGGAEQRRSRALRRPPPARPRPAPSARAHARSGCRSRRRPTSASIQRGPGASRLALAQRQQAGVHQRHGQQVAPAEPRLGQVARGALGSGRPDVARMRETQMLETSACQRSPRRRNVASTSCASSSARASSPRASAASDDDAARRRGERCRRVPPASPARRARAARPRRPPRSRPTAASRPPPVRAGAARRRGSAPRARRRTTRRPRGCGRTATGTASARSARPGRRSWRPRASIQATAARRFGSSRSSRSLHTGSSGRALRRRRPARARRRRRRGRGGGLGLTARLELLGGVLADGRLHRVVGP